MFITPHGGPVEAQNVVNRFFKLLLVLATERALTPSGRAKAMVGAAALAFLRGDLPRTAALAEEGIRLARESADQGILATATHVGAYAAVSRGEHASAAAFAGESVALHRALGDPSGAGLALTGLAHVAMAGGNFARAGGLLDESEELLRAAGSWWNLSVALNIRATASAMLGDHG